MGCPPDAKATADQREEAAECCEEGPPSFEVLIGPANDFIGVAHLLIYKKASGEVHQTGDEADYQAN